MLLAERVKPCVLRRNDETELRVQANLDQALGSERSSRGPVLAFAPGSRTQTCQYFPIRIHERQKNLRTTLNLESRCARENHSGGLIERQVVRPTQREPNERARVTRWCDEDRARGGMVLTQSANSWMLKAESNV